MVEFSAGALLAMERVGPYEIVAEVGRGGMGVVYRAVDSHIGRPVAVKVIRLGDLIDPEEQEQLRGRLFREARAAGILKHAGIVTIYYVGEERGVAFIAMEYVNGPTLERLLLADVPLPKQRIRQILAEAAAALDYAHRKGIVHRDIKPANIMLEENETVKICDFGIAKGFTGLSSMTQAGMVIGTPHYMAPEQIQGKSVDAAADQYGLAVIAFQALTGQRPFQADSVQTLFYRIITEPPQMAHRLNLTLPPAVDDVFEKALAKEPNNRYPTCGVFVAELLKACDTYPDWNPLPRRAPVGSGSTPPRSAARAVPISVPVPPALSPQPQEAAAAPFPEQFPGRGSPPAQPPNLAPRQPGWGFERPSSEEPLFLPASVELEPAPRGADEVHDASGESPPAPASSEPGIEAFKELSHADKRAGTVGFTTAFADFAEDAEAPPLALVQEHAPRFGEPHFELEFSRAGPEEPIVQTSAPAELETEAVIPIAPAQSGEEAASAATGPPLPRWAVGADTTRTSKLPMLRPVLIAAALLTLVLVALWLIVSRAGRVQIVEFAADRDAAAPLQPVALRWKVSRAEVCRIAPDVGAVPLAGNVTVHPNTTTTYTLSASGRGTSVSAQVTVSIARQIPTIGPPKQIETSLANARDLFSRGLYDKAIAAYQGVLAADSSNLQAQAGIAEARAAREAELRLSGGGSERRDEILRKARQMYDKGEYEAAIAAFERVLAINPDSTSAKRGLAAAKASAEAEKSMR